MSKVRWHCRYSRAREQRPPEDTRNGRYETSIVVGRRLEAVILLCLGGVDTCIGMCVKSSVVVKTWHVYHH